MHCALIVDDEPLIREFIRIQLEATGHWRCLEAADGRNAMQEVEKNHDIVLVVTDVLMPHMDGLQLICALKKTSRPPKVLAISAGGKFGTDLYLEDAAKLGADGVLFKPFTGEQLKKAVRELIPANTAEEIEKTA